MMDRYDVTKVIQSLQNFPFICHEDFIETENGYIITTKKRKKQLEEVIERDKERRNSGERAKRTF